MKPTGLRSFFVSLKTSDLRYKRDEGSAEPGHSIVSDAYLSINTGVGLAEYGFSNQIFPSRLFSGIIYYSHQSDCEAPNSQDLVTFSFYTRENGSSHNELIDELSSLVTGAIESLLDSQLSGIRDENKVKVDAVNCTIPLSNQGKFTTTRHQFLSHS